jgi:hypothetical protein
MSNDKEREAFEAHWIKEGNPRNSLAKWNDIADVPAAFRGAYVMACTRDAWSAWQARASLAASAGSEPVATGSIAHLKLMMEASAWGGELQLSDALANIDDFAAAHPSPPEGMVGGWRPIETAPKERGARFIGLTTTGRAVTAEPMYCVYDGPAEFRGWLEVERGSVVSVDLKGWQPLHTPPLAAGGGREADHG